MTGTVLANVGKEYVSAFISCSFDTNVDKCMPAVGLHYVFEFIQLCVNTFLHLFV